MFSGCWLYFSALFANEKAGTIVSVECDRNRRDRDGRASRGLYSPSGDSGQGYGPQVHGQSWSFSLSLYRVGPDEKLHMTISGGGKPHRNK